MIERRSLLTSLLFAPAIIRTPGLLMPISRPFNVSIRNIFPVLHGDTVSVVSSRSFGLFTMPSTGYFIVYTNGQTEFTKQEPKP